METPDWTSLLDQGSARAEGAVVAVVELDNTALYTSGSIKGCSKGAPAVRGKQD